MKKLFLVALSTVLMISTTFASPYASRANKGVMIFPESESQQLVAKKSGESVVLAGKVCAVKLKKNHHNYKCEPFNSDILDLKFFYPDAVTDVTDQVNVIRGNKEIGYEFIVDELPELHSSLSVVVSTKKGNTQVRRLLRLRDKISHYKKHFNRRLEKVRFKVKKNKEEREEWLENGLVLLDSIQQKIENTLSNSGNIIARYESPIQIDNQYTQSLIYESVFNEKKLYFKSLPGSPIEGEDASIQYGLVDFPDKEEVKKIKFKNHSQIDDFEFFSDDEYFLSLSYLGDEVIEIPFQGDDLHQSFETPRLYTDKRHDFSVGLYRSKKRGEEKGKGSSKKDLFGLIKAELPLAQDQTAPTWDERSPEADMSYKKSFFTASAQVIDHFGRVDSASLQSKLIGHTLSGSVYERELNDLTTIQSIDRERKYKVESSTQELPLEEGDYSIQHRIEDFAHNQAVNYPEEFHFRIDKTEPFILADFNDGYLTNEPQLSIPVEIDDISPVYVQVYLNDKLVIETDQHDFIANLELKEGNNVIDIFATDAAGNIAEPVIYRDVELDTIPPEIANLSPTDQSTVFNLDFILEGEPNEALSKIVINDVEYEGGDSSFSIPLFTMEEGYFDVEAIFYDLAGNEKRLDLTYEIILKILNGELISIKPLDDGKLQVVGGAFAAKPGVTVNIDGGFFNSTSVVADEEGRFVVDLSSFKSVYLNASDFESSRSDEVFLEYNANTTLSGVVKSIEGQALKGATVSIVGNDVEVQTDDTGTFYIANPVTGDQVVSIDGSTIPEEYRGENKKYSKTNIAVSIGTRQLNVIEDAIYLSPLLLDGSETSIADGESATVTSPHAPGVSLYIEGDTVNFPNGGETGEINIIEIESDFTSVKVPGFAEPETVYAFEPSGLKFSEPTELTLPNDNELPEGSQVVIMSKNSEKGIWEIDGLARVDDGGASITTEEGGGITHFSEIYAAPLGPTFKKLGGNEKPGADTFNGTASTYVELPSYKTLGEDIAPKLTYRSNWARPGVVVTNLFDIPRQEFSFVLGEDDGVRRLSGFTDVVSRGKSYVVPDYLDVQFFSGDFASEKMRFNGPPNKGVVSYAMDLSSQSDGIEPYQSRYEMKLKNMVVGTTTGTYKSGLFGRTKTSQQSFRETREIEQVFSSDITGSLITQNKKNSSYGTGWRLNLGDRILNPGNNRVVLESASGETSLYALTDKIETVYESAYDDFFSANIGQNDDFLIVDADQKLRRFTASSSSTEELANIPQRTGKYAFGVEAERYPDCNYYYRNVTRQRDIEQILELPNGDTYFTDGYGHILRRQEDSFSVIAGGYRRIPRHKFYERNFCQTSGVSCSGRIRHRGLYTSRSWGDCWYPGNSSGSIQRQGFKNGALNSALFNTPKGIVAAPEASSLLVADYGNNRIRKIDLISNSVETFAGNGQTYDNGDGGKAIEASMYRPQGLLFDNFGNLYVSTYRGYIRKISPDGRITHFAGRAVQDGGSLTDSAHAEDMSFNQPYGMVIDDENQYMYVADMGNHRVVRIDLVTKKAQTVAGTGECLTQGDIGDGGTALGASLCHPKFVGLDSNGDLLIFDQGHKRVRKVIFSTNSTSQLAYAPNSEDGSKLFMNQDGSYELFYRNGSISKFNAEGYQTNQMDLSNREVSYLYDSNNRLTSFIDPTGSETLFYYSGDKLTSIVDPANRETRFFYQGDRLVEVLFPDATSKSFQYDSKGLLTQETDQRGNSTQYIYNEWMRLHKVIRPDSHELVIQDKGSATVGNSYTSGQVGSLKQLGDDAYDGITDAKGTTTIFDSDVEGYISKVTDADGRVTEIERDIKGRPIKITRPDLSYTEFTYDQDTGDLLKKYDSDTDTEIFYEYDQFGNVISESDFRGYVVEKNYSESTGLLMSTKNQLGQVQSFTYNEWGLIETKTNHIGQTTTYAYDQYGNLATITAPDGSQTHLQRDMAGNVIARTGASNKTTQYVHDDFNRLISVKSPEDEMTEYYYLETGELSTIIDPHDNQTSFVYDEMGQLVQKVDPLGGTTQMSYDPNGNIIQEVDPAGNLKSFEYDHLDQLVKKSLPDDTYEMAYDVRGNMVEIQNDVSRINFDYMKAGDEYLVADTYVEGRGSESDLPSFTVSYDYDPNGNRIAMQTPVGLFDYYYDAGNRLTEMTNHKDENFTFSYDSANRMTEITRPGSKSTLSFDQTNFVTSFVHKNNSGQTLASYQYERDPIGNRTRMVASEGEYNYEYDQNSQLTKASSPLMDPEGFKYDDLGNRIEDATGQYVYDEKRQRLKEDSRFIYSYDDNGNLSGKVSRQDNTSVNYIHNSENRLIKIESFEGATKIKEVRYVYDALGRRVKKEIVDLQDSSNSFTRKYGYDGEEMLFEFNEHNQLMSTFTHSTLRSDDMLAVDFESIAVSEGRSKQTGSLFYLKDALGSVKELADSSGNVQQRYSYSSFGKLISVTDASGSDIKDDPVVDPYLTYTGRELDVESGLYYYRARYYDSSVGRFLSQDINQGDLRDPQTIISKYIYTENNPLYFTDPSGEVSVAIAPDVHGNYCGGEANGQVTDRFGNTQGDALPAIDNLDHSCRRHDRAYTLLDDNHAAINLNLNDSWGRVETDFHLVRDGVLKIPEDPVAGIGTAVFGSLLLQFYSIPMFVIGLPIGILETIF